MIPLLLAALLGLAALLVVIQPLLAAKSDPTPETASATPLTESIEREQTAKQALLDVELDHRLGNLEAGDYAALRARYEERALAALKARYDAERTLDAAIDQQLARLRARRAGGKDLRATTQTTRQPRSSPATRRNGSVRARRRRGA